MVCLPVKSLSPQFWDLLRNDAARVDRSAERRVAIGPIFFGGKSSPGFYMRAQDPKIRRPDVNGRYLLWIAVARDTHSRSTEVVRSDILEHICLGRNRIDLRNGECQAISAGSSKPKLNDPV